ncbi:MAG: hypothetical protein QXR42_07485, partial [Candidatus Bathyarchaeia archaeon]
MTENKEKGKTLVIVIGVLVVALIGSNFVTYMNMQGQISTLTAEKANLQQQLTALNTQYQNYVSTHAHSNSEYDDLQDDLNFYYDLYLQWRDYAYDLEDEVNFWNDIANLNFNQVLIDHQTVIVSYGYTYWHWYDIQIYYASYITVTLHSTSVSGTYIRVIWSAYGVNFDQTVYLNAGQSASFPLLPCSNLDI